MHKTVEERILAELNGLRAGTTMCPGMLSRRLGARLADLRPTFERLAREGRVAILQGGKSADVETLKGPFRVAPVSRGSAESRCDPHTPPRSRS